MKNELMINILKSGGYFRKMLERDSYTGREQFKVRLMKAGETVNGFGFAAMQKAIESGLIKRDFEALYGSTACEMWRYAE